MKVFVCHYSPLTVRKKYLDKVLPELGFADIEWVTEKDIINYDLSKVYDSSPQALSLRNSTSFAKFGVKNHRILRKSEAELTLQHFECYRRIFEQNLDMAVIFEDDVIFKNHFVKRFNQYLEELPSSFDVLYFGKGCGHHRSPMSILDFFNNLSGKKYLFKNRECRSRFTDSYVVSHAAAGKFFQKGLPFHLPIDWELNYLQSWLDMEIYWAEPTLTFQGSKYGYYKSSLKEVNS